MKIWINALAYWFFVALIVLAPVDIALPKVTGHFGAGIAANVLREHVRFFTTMFLFIRLGGDSVRLAVVAALAQLSPMVRSLFGWYLCAILVYVTFAVGAFLPVIVSCLKIAALCWLIKRCLFRWAEA